MRPNLSRQQIQTSFNKKKKMIYMITGLALCYVVIFFLFGEVNLFHFYSMRKTYFQMKNEIDHLKADNLILKKEAEALRSDPQQIEKLAREQLDLSRKGEIIYEFPKPEQPPPTP